ncbi:metallophosphoesterase [Bradyrhizobium sp. 27S5]|uniref:metallophosphoesterase n=1 Tax=Bradyrhizobium sp. 27S5 TaxID=3139728 RepID=UPI0030CFB367
MPDRTLFLHLTDAHVSAKGVPHARDDIKVEVPGLLGGTREAALVHLFSRFAEWLEKEKLPLDGVIFSGDAQNKGDPGGHELVLEVILNKLGPFGIVPGKIVATPGNHDVPQGSLPSDPGRYAAFNKVWRDAGCIVPWLDGIDKDSPIEHPERHRLVAPDLSWAIFPINTSNWSHVAAVLPEPLRNVWDRIPETMAPGNPDEAARIARQLESLARFDMARVSDEQLDVLRRLMADTAKPPGGRQLRVAVMHHHLRTPSLREELKAFADISNLEHVRAMLRAGGIDAVIHGHKHEHAVYYDHVYGADGEEAQRILVISGATFAQGSEQDAMRLVDVGGLPHVPEISVQPLPLPRSGSDWHPGQAIRRRLWIQNERSGAPVLVVPNAPIVIEGSDLDEVYARACAAASNDAKRATLIIHLDMPWTRNDELPLPTDYPMPSGQGDPRDVWLRDLVGWWQRDRSQLEHRIPYVHGARLRRYGGKIDQIRRIIDLLRMKESTRALAILVDPFRDFNQDLTREEFASFCLVEFRRRNDGTRTVVDAIAFYRAQEFARWWPINIAELRLLQNEICGETRFEPGRITTIAADARTIARSPTQVAMPIVDRWLDQIPERLHLLADALVHRQIGGEAQKKAVVGWRSALAELRGATDGFNPDGVPLAIEGLATLAAYIQASAAPTDDEVLGMARRLRELADHNQQYERTKREASDHARWSQTAKRYIDELEEVTTART